ncbi:MAG: hypothetical protein HPY85_13915 [Anaerolineae bacterium]|nr:hypothetical protein [Anaerolineae bacterium]
MNEILKLLNEFFRLLERYEIWAYVILGVIAFFFIQRLMNAMDAMKLATFKLEKDVATRRFQANVAGLVILFLVGGFIFTSVTFIAPAVPWDGSLSTPTIDLLVTPTTTMAPTEDVVLFPGETTPTPVFGSDGCVAGVFEWTYPLEGDGISGVIEPRGTVNFATLGFYKYEYAPAGSDDWQTISAGNQLIEDQLLGGAWNTETVTPGLYQLRLIATDNQNNYLPPCTINVQINP